MKGIRVALAVLIVLTMAAALAVATAGGPAASARSAGPASSPIAKTVDQCTFIVAGKDATADGSVLMSYNNDWSAANFAYVKVVTPPNRLEYRYLRLLTWGNVPEGGLNQVGLAANYGVATGLAAEVLAADPYATNGVGGDLWDLILKKCRTARQAIDLLARIAQTRGFAAGAAGSFAVADADEAWVFELLGGHHWVAARVPDDAYYVQPNMQRIRQVDLGRPDRFRGSPDLEQFAVDIGRYDPAEGPFDVAWAYGDRGRLESWYSTNRLWGIVDRLSPSLGLSVAMPYATRPVFVRPDHPLTRQDLMAAMREHYVGTELDQTEGYTLMSPHAQTCRPVCYSTTDYSAVWQLRRGMPAAIGDVMWLALSRPCSSAYVPFYAGVTDVPQRWSQKRAYLAFRKVADSLDAPGTVDGDIRYLHYIGLVRGVYEAFEAELAAQQADVEATAAGLWASSPQAAEAYLTQYVWTQAERAKQLAEELAAEMP
jgi:dipeptidase